MGKKVGGKRGFVVQRRPGEYAKTTAQNAITTANLACGIQKGMPRKDLFRAMTECLPEYWANLKKTPKETQKDGND